MSVEAMSWVLHHSPTTGTDKVILLGIANHADEAGGNAWPSVATLATYACISERSAQAALRRLAAEGHITVELQAGGTHRTRADRRTNLYTVVGVQPTSPRAVDGVKPGAARGEAQRAHGVKPTAPEPSLNHPEPSSEEGHRVTDLMAALEESMAAAKIQAACAVIAQRALARRQGPPVASPRKWKAKVAEEAYAEHHEEAARVLAAEPSLTFQQLASRLEGPQPATVRPFTPPVWQDDTPAPPEVAYAALNEAKAVLGRG